jgi:glycosyltransferase involved in cell wall biosynthesis
MRVAMVCTFYPPWAFGGDAISTERWAEALARRGHDVTVIHDTDAYRTLAREPRAPPSPEPAHPNVTVIGLRSAWPRLSALLVHQLGRPVLHRRALQRLLAPGRFDVVVCHNPSLIGGPELLTWDTGATTVYMAHEFWLVCPTHVLLRDGERPCTGQACFTCTLRQCRPPQLWRYGRLIARAMQAMDLRIVLSPFARATHRAFGLDVPMEVVPNFVPDALLAEGPAHASPHHRPYLFFAGRLERLKGLDDVLPLFRDGEGPDLLIAGTGSHEATLRRLAQDAPRIRFLGHLPREAMQQHYAHALATLLPSICYENFPLVLLEAMAAGSPLVVRHLGPLPDIVATTGAGTTFRDAAELAEHVTRLQADATWRQTMAEAARRSAETTYAESRVVDQFLALVATARERRRAGAR